MKQVLLSDVCEINPRSDSGISDDAECSFVPMEYVDDISGTIANTSIRRVGDVKKGYTFFKNDDVIFAKITPCMENGKCAIGKNLKNGIAFGSTEYHVVRAKEEIIPEWIYHFLRQEKVRQQAKGWFRGTAGQQRVPATFLEELKIPLPPLTEQKRIASLLTRADRLRHLRRTAHELGESLLQSVFLEMFGDVVRNDKGWKIMSLKQTCDEIYRYPTFYGFDYVEDGVPVVRIGDILLNGEVNPNLENYVCISPEINKRFPRTILELGDILMAVRGDGSTGKRIGMVKSKNLVGSNISPNLLRFKANEKFVSPSYLFTFMTSSGGQELIDRYITRTAKKTITSADIQTIKIPVPPLSLQEEFADVVRRVESLRGRMGESARQVEGLFESLLAESFGE